MTCPVLECCGLYVAKAYGRWPSFRPCQFRCWSIVDLRHSQSPSATWYIVALEVFANEMVSKRYSDDPVMIPLEICLCHVPEEVEPTAWLPWLESSEQHRENGEHHCSHRVLFNRHEYSCRYIMRCIQRLVFVYVR